MMIMAHQYNTPQITLKVTSWLPRISHSSEYREAAISAPNRQNTVRLIFEKNELGAFSESLGLKDSENVPNSFFLKINRTVF